ncbi:hypothetical protein HDC94_002830 [Leifsonia sp. AK011]|uniref:hypothetical protein n=1 Tax=Leifsonia sp. AK011 TaxID=2723075 RepID=UPI0015CBA8C2|nr:hypothetical protein [Leifsonia sp. AK011]NYF11674.1 hypothetical protein [Leifsonia sp. AK011]
MTQPRSSAWLKLLSRFVSVQILVQVLGFITGLLVVRTLDKPSYAQYAAIAAIIASMILVSDGGVSSTLLSVGSRVFRSKDRIAALFTTAGRYRAWIGAGVSLLSAPLLIFILIRNGATVGDSLVYAAIAVASFWPTVAKGISQNYLRLAGAAVRIQIYSLVAAVARVVLVLALSSLGFDTLLPYLLVSVVAAVIEMLLVRRYFRSQVPASGVYSPHLASMIGANLKHTMPSTLLVVAQGQVLFLLLSILGTPDTLAEVAALSRFALVFVLLNAAVTDIGSGIAARAAPTRHRLLRVLAAIVGSYLVLAALFVLAAWILSPQLIWLLGPQYSGLETQLVIIAAGSALINLAVALRTFNYSRGWVQLSWLLLPLMVGWVALGVFVFDLDTSTGAALFMATQGIATLTTQVACALAGYRKLRA